MREIQTVVAGGWEKGDVYPNPDGFCSYFLQKLGKRDKVFMCLASAGLVASGVLLSQHFRRGLEPLTVEDEKATNGTEKARQCAGECPVAV